MARDEELNLFLFSHERISVANLPRQLDGSAAGATSIFIGTTRNSFDGKRVVLLEYEAYTKMALKEMQAIGDRARQKWPEIIGITICHRLGKVPIGEDSVIIAVSSIHRRDAIGSCPCLSSFRLGIRLPFVDKPATRSHTEFAPI